MEILILELGKNNTLLKILTVYLSYRISTKLKMYRAILEFLKDLNLCVINGRVTPEKNAFTCINSTGMSFVDYFVTFQDDLKYIKSCKIYTLADLLNKCNLCSQLGDRCTASDHSVLCIDISPSGDNISELSTNFRITNKDYKQNSVNNNANNLKGRKFYFDQCSSDFMNSKK